MSSVQRVREKSELMYPYEHSGCGHIINYDK